MPVSVSVPAPVLVRPVEPLMTPDSVPVIVAATSTVPPPVPNAMALVKVSVPVRASVVPVSVTVPPTSALLEPTDSVPAATVTPPVRPVLLVEADSVSVPVPVLVSAWAPPDSAPDRVTAASVWIVAAPLSATALSMVVAPVTWSVVPAASVTAPVPRLPSAATLSVPAETVVVPE